MTGQVLLKQRQLLFHKMLMQVGQGQSYSGFSFKFISHPNPFNNKNIQG